MFRNLSIYAALTAMIFATVAHAQEEEHGHFDVFVATFGGSTVCGGIDVDDGDVELGALVFESEMGDNPISNIFFADEPGFNHPADDAVLPAGASSLADGDEIFVNGLNLTVGGVTGSLFYWDGVGPVSFTPPSGTSFDIVTPTSTGSIGTAGVGGGFDDHPEFELSSGGTLPAAGIYLGSFEAQVNDLTPCGPMFLVMGTEGLITADFLGIDQAAFDMLTDEQLDEELEEVIEMAAGYVEANVVPEPSAFVLAGIGLLTLMSFRRKSRR